MPPVPSGVEFVAPGLAVLTIAISLPLVFRKIPPNPLYGFRTCKTMSDPQIWYEANYRGGIMFIIASVAALAGWALLRLVYGRATAAFYGPFVLVAAIVAATIMWVVRMRDV